MNFLNTYLPQITGVLVVAILLGVGRAKLLPAVKTSRALLWLAWIVTVVCGLVLGWALVGVMGWLTSLTGPGASLIGSIGALAGLWAGWHSVLLLIAMVRDLADKTPDGDARKAALWVPTFLPAGWQAVWGVVTNPRGLGTGLTAAIMAGITIAYAHMIVQAALRGKTARKAWLWFSAGVCLMAGLVATPLVLYLDGVAATNLAGTWVAAGRVLAGAFGLALLIAAAVDIKDRVPDAYVRSFLRFGLPLLLAFGTLAVTTISGYAGNGGQLLGGTTQSGTAGQSAVRPPR
jgi:hypothetical protein